MTVLYVSPTQTEIARLAAEKARNALGLLASQDAEHADETLSLASFGGELGESALVREIIARHPSVVRITDPERFPKIANYFTF